MLPEPTAPRPAPALAQRDLRIDVTRDPCGCVAEALTTIFPPAARAPVDVGGRQFLLAPFSGPARFAASAGIPFACKVRLPGSPPLVSQAHPREMKILVQQYSAMLPRAGFQAIVKNDQSPPDECRGVGGIARRVAKIAAVPDPDLSAVKKPGDRGIHQPTINCMDLAALLTEQANPASAHIDKLATEDMLRVIGV